MHIKSHDNNVQLSIEGHVFHANLKENQKGTFYIKFSDEIRSYKLDCTGCGLDVDARIIVQSKKEFDKFQERDCREQSERYRKKLDTHQKRESKESYKRPNKNERAYKYKSDFYSEEE